MIYSMPTAMQSIYGPCSNNSCHFSATEATGNMQINKCGFVPINSIYGIMGI